MATLYHGTTRENWESIQREGWLGDSHKPVWNCSMREIYFNDTSKADGDDCSLINDTFEQAQIAAAVQNYKGANLVVLRFEIPDEFVEDDSSCPNAEQASAVHPDYMDKAELTGIYNSDQYNPSLRLFYICGLLAGNDFINQEYFTALEIEAAKKLHETDCYLEDLFCHESHTEIEKVAA